MQFRDFLRCKSRDHWHCSAAIHSLSQLYRELTSSLEYALSVRVYLRLRGSMTREPEFDQRRKLVIWSAAVFICSQGLSQEFETTRRPLDIPCSISESVASVKSSCMTPPHCPWPAASNDLAKPPPVTHEMRPAVRITKRQRATFAQFEKYITFHKRLRISKVQILKS